MARLIKSGSVRVRVNTDELIRKFDANLPSGKLKSKVWTDVKYAVFVEYGTSIQKPSGMVRKSMPEIRQKFNDEWKQLPQNPTVEQLEDLMNRVAEFARKTIADATPVKSGDLQKSWKAEDAEWER